MTALANDRKTPRLADGPITHTLPVADSALIYAGALVALNLAGYAVPASADPALRVVGVAEARVDNSDGGDGDLTVEVREGAHGLKNSGTTGALTAADIGRLCYVVDDQTVSRIPALGARPVAGRVVTVDADDDLVYVETGISVPTADGTVDLLCLAGADLSSTGQFLFVEMGTAGTVTVCNAAGEDACGVLQNAPGNGAVAIVRVAGRSKVIASGAINPGVLLATTNAGKSKAAVAGNFDADGNAQTNASLDGSFVMGRALTLGATDTAHEMLIAPMGLIPTTAQ